MLNILKGMKNPHNHDLNYIYKKELDKACFAHAATYADSKDLTKKNCVSQGFEI